MKPSKKTYRSTHSTPSNVIQIHPQRVADVELEWFFTMRESDQGARSNFMNGLLPLRHREHHDDDLVRRIAARTAERAIYSWLAAIERPGAPHAGVLKVAYAPRPWPLALYEELGRIAGIVVRLASADLGLPDDDAALDALERSTALALTQGITTGARSLERLRKEATTLYSLAVRAYERERGGGPCIVGRWG